jgi:hypothetical protein
VLFVIPRDLNKPRQKERDGPQDRHNETGFSQQSHNKRPHPQTTEKLSSTGEIEAVVLYLPCWKTSEISWIKHPLNMLDAPVPKYTLTRGKPTKSDAWAIRGEQEEPWSTKSSLVWK